MASPTDIRKGRVLLYNGSPHSVISMLHRTPGRRMGFIQTVLRNLSTSASVTVKFRSTDNIEFCHTTNRQLEFSYIDGDIYHFIDPNTFDDVMVSASTLGEDTKWLIEGTVYTILFVDGSPVSVELPNNIDMEVAEAAEGLAGDTATSATKPVTLVNGEVIQVPLFVKRGDKIRIRSEDNTYVSRV